MLVADIKPRSLNRRFTCFDILLTHWLNLIHKSSRFHKFSSPHLYAKRQNRIDQRRYRKILQQFDPEKVIIFSRDELKQSEMAADLTFALGKFRFFLDHNNCVPSPSPLGQGPFKTLGIRTLRDKI